MYTHLCVHGYVCGGGAVLSFPILMAPSNPLAAVRCLQGTANCMRVCVPAGAGG